MPDAELERQARDFAQRLTDLLNATVTTGAAVTVFMHEDAHRATVSPGAAQRLSDMELVPLSTARTKRELGGAGLWLKVGYVVGLDDERAYLAVHTSVFGLCVNPATGYCPLRVEYERRLSARQAAHVHIHGESAGLGYAYAMAGRPPKGLDKLHFPVGGRRFRPTLEDFIEFLHQEGLVTDVKATWKQAIEQGRADWETRQVRAAVRRAPDAAITQIREMGYEVRRTS